MEFLKLFMHPKDLSNKKFIKEVIKNNGVPFESLKWELQDFMGQLGHDLDIER